VQAISESFEYAIAANVSEINHASAWLEKICVEKLVPAEQLIRLDLCLNEVLANIIHHGGLGAQEQPIILQLSICNHDELSCEAKLTISDTGMPFDPLSAPEKTRPKTLADAVPGGLGVVMIKKLTDDCHYIYRDKRNMLSFSVVWAKPR
jgi:serine/threonine-protein kinase RsbW